MNNDELIVNLIQVSQMYGGICNSWSCPYSHRCETWGCAMIWEAVKRLQEQPESEG